MEEINRGLEESRRRDYGGDDEGGGGSGIDGEGDAVAMDGGEVDGGGVGMRLTKSGWGCRVWEKSKEEDGCLDVVKDKVGCLDVVKDKVGCLVNKITSIREEF